MIRVTPLPALADNYIYALVSGQQCAVVDPGEASPVLKFVLAHNLHLTHILCTHHHHDHVGGIAELLQQTPGPVEVWCSTYDQSRVPQVTRGLREGEAVGLFGESINVIELPGHTLGQIAFHLPKENALFAGDTLFSCGCGRLFEGSAEQMYHSLQKIKALPPATQLYFGHEYTLRNIDFNLQVFGENAPLKAFREKMVERLHQDGRTTPGTLKQELEVNPTLKAQSVTEFRTWRTARDQWVAPAL